MGDDVILSFVPPPFSQNSSKPPSLVGMSQQKDWEAAENCSNLQRSISGALKPRTFLRKSWSSRSYAHSGKHSNQNEGPTHIGRDGKWDSDRVWHPEKGRGFHVFDRFH